MSNVNQNPRYTDSLAGKTIDFYWGSDTDYLPFVDFDLKGGSFCQGFGATLFSKWPLYDPLSFFKETNPKVEDKVNNRYCQHIDNKWPVLLGTTIGE